MKLITIQQVLEKEGWYRRLSHVSLIAALAIALCATQIRAFGQIQNDGGASPTLPAQEESRRFASQLQKADRNRTELERAVALAPPNQQAAVKFLIANMSPHDLQSLTAEFLLGNVRLAFEARQRAPWKVSDSLFLNDVLPYANIDEPRDPWRQDFYDLCWPLVEGCRTPSEAAQKLNEGVFAKLGVKYSTARRRANQSPRESIEQGLASCTGLSIILVDACRSVGVPARLVGIPSWKNKHGNHTWVEIWDQKWNFTGAAEPSGKGLNHTWFQNDAALADPNSELHSIYAVCFHQTETRFPMVWSPGKTVYAENVTKRYLPANPKQPLKDVVNVMIRVWNPDRSQRLEAAVTIAAKSDRQPLISERSRGNTADMNDMLTVKLKPDMSYRVRISHPQGTMDSELRTDGKQNQLFEFVLPASAEPTQSMTDAQVTQVTEIAKKLFAVNEHGEWPATEVEIPQTANRLLKTHPEHVRQIAWESYLQSPLGRKCNADFESNQVTFKKHVSPYTVKEVGERSADGWPLFIAMHGGGGASQRVNDSQWRHMQVYYKDQPQLAGYKYLALRAPNNSWNGFYDDYVYPLIENLIQQQVVFGDVDPNRVFLMGYSHGGYGAFAIGPKIPYRFAAIHSSAAAPTDGQSSAKTLRNTRFTFMVGENDNAYGRRERCENFARQIEELKDDREDVFPVDFLFQPGYGHGGLPDRDMIETMYDHVRDPTPKHLTWEMTDSVVDQFYWLSVKKPATGKFVDARIEGNRVQIRATGLEQVTVHLDGRLIDPNKPLVIQSGDQSQQLDYQPKLNTLCRSIAELGDINLAFDFDYQVNLTPTH